MDTTIKDYQIAMEGSESLSVFMGGEMDDIALLIILGLIVVVLAQRSRINYLKGRVQFLKRELDSKTAFSNQLLDQLAEIDRATRTKFNRREEWPEIIDG
ncbi:MAG TPA: hypothetical protein VGB17_06270 [Pyrinomonadaceae bacterium]